MGHLHPATPHDPPREVTFYFPRKQPLELNGEPCVVQLTTSDVTVSTRTNDGSHQLSSLWGLAVGKVRI